MGELHVLRTLGKHRDYKPTNGQRSQTQVMIVLACAVISPLYSEKHTAQKNSCFPSFCQKDLSTGTSDRWALALSSRDLKKEKILTPKDKFLEDGRNSIHYP